MKSDEKKSKKFYDMIATEYHEKRTDKYPHGWFFNEYLEMPAMFKALGNVKRKKILDLGCGSGIYAKILTKKGAIVKGFDISHEMIKIAQKDNPSLDLRVGSGYKIPFNEKFDIVIASLAMGYMSDWKKVFSEILRVLNPKGVFIFSTNNPVSDCKVKESIGNKNFTILGKNNYFEENAKFHRWDTERGKVSVPWNHKTYEYIIKTIVQSNFELIDYIDAKPLPSAKKYFPEYYAEYSRIPRFCVWKVRKK